MRLYLTRDPARHRFEEHATRSVRDAQTACARWMRVRLRAEMQGGILFISDGELFHPRRVPRNRGRHVRRCGLPVALAAKGIIPRERGTDARPSPRTLTELLHRQVDPRVETRCDRARQLLPVPAPAHKARSCSTPMTPKASAARGEKCILCAAKPRPGISRYACGQAVLTERGGITSHAAVIGRGNGPARALFGASLCDFDAWSQGLITALGRADV